VDPEYLKNKATSSGLVTDYRDWQIPLGRRFRSLKLWLVLRVYGIEKLQEYLRHHIALSEYLHNHFSSQDNFEIVAPRVSSLVCLRYRPKDGSWDLEKENRFNQLLLENINNSGVMYLSHTVLNQKYTLRVAVCGSFTNQQHVDFAISTIEDQLSKLLANFDKEYQP